MQGTGEVQEIQKEYCLYNWLYSQYLFNNIFVYDSF